MFPAAFGKTGKLSRQPLVRTDAADMLKRRLKQAGLPAHYSPHSFRAKVSRIFWKMTALLKPLSASPVTPTAGPQNFMIAADRRCYWRTWRGFATKFCRFAAALVQWMSAIHIGDLQTLGRSEDRTQNMWCEVAPSSHKERFLRTKEKRSSEP